MIILKSKFIKRWRGKDGKYRYLYRQPSGRKKESEQRLAPNGKPSNLSEFQYKQVRTPEFKKWFGDWENDPDTASKVIDENGEPLVLYRHDKSEIKVFDPDKTGKGGEQFGSGFYFTDKKEYASLYGENLNQYFLSIKNPITWDRADSKTVKKAQRIAKPWGVVIGYTVNKPELFTAKLKENKYDGIVVALRDKVGTKEIISFESTQIKSASQNKGIQSR